MRYLSKKNYHIEEESEGSWAVSYGDMITLLLSFFVIFFTTDLKKEQASSLNSYMSFSMEELKNIPVELMKKDAQNLDVKRLEGLDIKVHQIKDKVIISFGRFSFFKSGQTELRSEGKLILNKFVEKYLPYAGTYSLSIKGFTDKTKVSLSPHKRFRDNLELSALRSISAMRVLQKSGIPLNRMEIAGAGEMSLIQQIITDSNSLTVNELNDYSRTIMIVISPEKESWL